MVKTEVYSWRLSLHLKAELEDAAQSENKSMAELLEQIAREWLERSSRSGSFEAQEERVRAAAMKCAGSIEGKDPERAQNARALVRARIASRHGR
jgi:hypothetical protein